MNALSEWGVVWGGGWAVGFGFAFLIWQTGYIARALTEFLRPR
jgi:hypothetical protein